TGPNGAGKTRLIDASAGFVRPGSGHVELGGQSLDRASVAKRARAGIARSFQSLELFEDMSVEENLRAASEPQDPGAYLINLVATRQVPLSSAALTAVHDFDFPSDLGRLPPELPYARRRVLAVARAVAMSPSILLLDE